MVVQDIRSMVSIHSLILEPEEDLPTWINFTRMCRKTSRFGVGERAAVRAVGGIERLDSLTSRSS
jgi:hypothetical protein